MVRRFARLTHVTMRAQMSLSGCPQELHGQMKGLSPDKANGDALIYALK